MGLNINLLDVIVVVVVIYYAIEGYSLGFVLAFFDLLSFILSFFLALKFYTFVAGFFVTYFFMHIGFAHAVGFFLIAFISEIIINIFFRRIICYLPTFHSHRRIARFFRDIDHLAGIVPGIISAFIVLAFLLTVIVSLPSSPFVKRLVTGSEIGSVLIANTSMFERKLNNVFGGALNETLNYLTVEPQSNEVVDLRFKTSGTVDEKSEEEMLIEINKEREANGLAVFKMDVNLRKLARSNSQDMLGRGYFSHYTPEGLSPFDRMKIRNIEYTYAGENLALASSPRLAMQGLMSSPGHRANILNPNFNRIGIGAIDGGIYGIMFSQEFTN
ncbi:CvpA family protein [Patescibacteria group bacterium]|nr:CvpA family protein [Patescibacteria group bacterium]